MVTNIRRTIPGGLDEDYTAGSANRRRRIPHNETAHAGQISQGARSAAQAMEWNRFAIENLILTPKRPLTLSQRGRGGA
jgi:hypothetical protein